MRPFDSLIVDISECLSIDPDRASDSNPLGRLQNAAIGIEGGRIAWIGRESELRADMRKTAGEILSARGAVAIPGLIDSHTHPVFGGSRENEFAKRLAGVPYMQIAAEGGGINSTVSATRESSAEALYVRAAGIIGEMLSYGVTTLEAKSGYGLSVESELKQLDVIGRLNDTLSTDIQATFLGAHEFPPEYRDNREAYVDLVIDEMLPAVAKQGIARFCDVFCEEGVFTPEQSRRILLAGREHGLLARFHADEFKDSGGALLAAEIGALACDHLMAVTPEGIAAMREAGVIAALLPATSYYLGHGHYANARAMLDAGLTVTVASDFNPGSAVVSNLPLVANMAATQMKMTFEEVMLAITHNAARSLGIEKTHGKLAAGAMADIVLLDVPRAEYFLYHVGRTHAWKVIKSGRVVHERTSAPLFLD